MDHISSINDLSALQVWLQAMTEPGLPRRSPVSVHPSFSQSTPEMNQRNYPRIVSMGHDLHRASINNNGKTAPYEPSEDAAPRASSGVILASNLTHIPMDAACRSQNDISALLALVDLSFTRQSNNLSSAGEALEMLREQNSYLRSQNVQLKRMIRELGHELDLMIRKSTLEPTVQTNQATFHQSAFEKLLQKGELENSRLSTQCAPGQQTDDLTNPFSRKTVPFLPHYTLSEQTRLFQPLPNSDAAIASPQTSGGKPLQAAFQEFLRAQVTPSPSNNFPIRFIPQTSTEAIPFLSSLMGKSSPEPVEMDHGPNDMNARFHNSACLTCDGHGVDPRMTPQDKASTSNGPTGCSFPNATEAYDLIRAINAFENYQKAVLNEQEYLDQAAQSSY